MSQWHRAASRSHPLPALTNNWTGAATHRHTTASISHNRPSPRSSWATTHFPSSEGLQAELMSWPEPTKWLLMRKKWTLPWGPKSIHNFFRFLHTDTDTDRYDNITCAAMVIVLFCRTQQTQKNWLRTLSYRKIAQLTDSLLDNYDNIVTVWTDNVPPVGQIIEIMTQLTESGE